MIGIGNILYMKYKAFMVYRSVPPPPLYMRVNGSLNKGPPPPTITLII